VDVGTEAAGVLFDFRVRGVPGLEINFAAPRMLNSATALPFSAAAFLIAGSSLASRR
jgi:hypothetical protein